MVNEFIKFLKNNYESILSISALIISLINLIYLLYTNKKKLIFQITNYTKAKVNNKNFYMFNVNLINKSRLPISVNEISFFNKAEIYTVIKSPRMLSEKSTTRNKEIIRHQEVHSVKFPINITGLTSEQNFIVMYGPETFQCEKVKIIISTNRGKIKLKINLNDYYLRPDDFTSETSEYYD